jgi:hypothetical protein
MACWRLVNEPRGSGVGFDVEGACAAPVALAFKVSPGLSSFLLFFLGAACVSSSRTAAGVGDRCDLLSLARLRFFRRAGRSPTVADADTPPRRVFSLSAGLAASCSITFSTFAVADWMLCESCLDFRLRFLGVTATGWPGTDHPGTSKRTMVRVAAENGVRALAAEQNRLIRHIGCCALLPITLAAFRVLLHRPF